jgi:hypothetical protein
MVAVTAIATCITLFSGFSLRAQTAAPVIAATSISKVPYVITQPGLYLVKKDLVYPSASGAAITIQASDVTVDLGGHVLSSGTTLNSSNHSVGVYALNPGSFITNFVVRNGTLKGFKQGVYLTAASTPGRILVEDLVTINTGQMGIFTSGINIEIRRCQAIDTGYQSASLPTTAFYASGTRVKISDNQAESLSTGAGGDSHGIVCYAADSAVIERNMISAGTDTGDYGIMCNNTPATGSTALTGNSINNFVDGISYTGSGEAKGRGNLTFNCTTPFSGVTKVGTENN